MRSIILFKNIKPLLRRTTFGAGEASELGVSTSLLAYYVSIGILERVSRGIYRNPGSDPRVEFQWQDLVLTVNSIPHGVVCLVSALGVYGLTDDIPRQHWIAVPNQTSAPTRANTIIKRLRDCETGKIQYRLGKETIAIFDKERTIVDCFRFLGQETALKALNNALKSNHPIDIQKLQRYAKKLRVDIIPYLQTMLSLV
jgi:predicted transcriptional regulator of viral defense system